MSLHYERISVTPFRQNCTLLWDDHSQEAVLVDAGGDAEKLSAAVAGHGLTLKGVWLSHGHLDHAGGVATLLETHPVPVWGPHQDDDYLLQQLPGITASYHFPVSPPVMPDGWLNEGDTVSVGNYTFRVFHIPGHTPGHVVFYCESEKLLLSGDVLFRETIGRTDFPRGNHDDLLRHIRRALFTLPDDTVVLPGHGPATTIGHEKTHNPFFR